MIQIKYLTAFCGLLTLMAVQPCLGTATSKDVAIQIIPSNSNAVAAISLTNGPPNLPTGLLATGLPSGSPVSDVYADNPDNGPFSGTFSITSGPFSVTTDTQCGTARNITCGHITTNQGNLSGLQSGTVVTSRGGSQTFTINFVSCTSNPTPGTNNLPTSGTVCLGTGTYTVTNEIHPANGTVYVGRPGQSVLDGGGSQVHAFGLYEGGSQNVTLANLTFQNYCSGCGSNPVIDGYIGTTIQNSVFNNNGGGGFNPVSSPWTVVNTVFNNTGWSTIHPQLSAGSGVANVIGNEMAFGNQNNGDTCDDTGVFKTFMNTPINWKYNYIHDNHGPGFWSDTVSGGGPFNITGNTFVRNGNGGIELEITIGLTQDIGYNVFIGNGNGDTYSAFICGNTNNPNQAWPDVWIHAARDSINIHDNNFVVVTGASSGYAEKPWSYQHDERDTGGISTNVVAQNNTVTFHNSSALWGADANDNPGLNHAGSFSNNNHFHIVGGSTNDAHFAWFPDLPCNYCSPNQVSFAQFRASPDSQEAGGSIDTFDMSANGCLHVACAINPVGPGGVPR